MRVELIFVPESEPQQDCCATAWLSLVPMRDLISVAVHLFYISDVPDGILMKKGMM